MSRPKDIRDYFHTAIIRDTCRINDSVFDIARHGGDFTPCFLRLQVLSEVWRAYARAEEATVFPAVDKVAPQVATAYLLDHKDIEERFEGLEIYGRKPPFDPLWMIMAVSGLRSFLWAHLGKDDAHLYAILRERTTEDEWAAIGVLMSKSVPPDKFPTVIQWLFPLFKLEEQVLVTKSLIKVMSPQVFDSIRPLIEKAVAGNWVSLIKLVPELEHAQAPARKIGDEHAEDNLVAELGDQEVNVRLSAADALVKMGGEHAADGAAVILKDKMGGDRAVDELLIALKGNNSDFRRMAAETLGKMGDARAVDGLIAAFNDQDWDVRNAAAEALGKIGGEHTVDKLIVALKDGDMDVNQRAVKALGMIGGKGTVDKLIVALKDEDVNVRRYAVVALGEIGDEHAVDGLIAVLKGQDSDLRFRAARALGTSGGDRAVDELVIALRDKDSMVASWAADSLGKIGNARALDVLVAALKDPDENVRTRAAGALKNLHK